MSDVVKACRNSASSSSGFGGGGSCEDFMPATSLSVAERTADASMDMLDDGSGA